jgi:hypothetical protein
VSMVLRSSCVKRSLVERSVCIDSKLSVSFPALNPPAPLTTSQPNPPNHNHKVRDSRRAKASEEAVTDSSGFAELG